MKIYASTFFFQTNEWETACRRKNKQSQNVRGVDTYDDEIRDTVPQSDNFDKPSSKGRGRGRNIKGRGLNFLKHCLYQLAVLTAKLEMNRYRS